ncbi:MAG TPA: GTPase HflX [Thermoanaerobaculia bacterium]
MENVIAIGLILPELTRSVAEEHLDELSKLIESAGATVTGRVIAKRAAPDPATYIGKGKAEEVKHLCEEQQATLIVFDDDLSPAQLRNLEKLIGARVIDRSALILDIFNSRAKTREARTQVELAQLEYMLPRLTRAWSHLERQGGGTSGGGGGGTGGARRGVGETQLELDRRIVRTRIAKLKEELKHIEKTRETQRRSRGEGAFTVSLVGYTNAGKSTLFNRLTTGGAEAMDKLFATLDAKSHKIAFEMPRETVVIDTVGFIRKLPHHLVASFRSTMEEAVASDLVLHVIDASHPQFSEQREVGEEVLNDLGVDPLRVVEVYNKADRLDEHFDPQRKQAILVSALTGRGIETLVDAIRVREREGGELMYLAIPHSEGRLVAQLHQRAEVQDQSTTDEAVVLTAWVPHDLTHLFRPFAVTPRRAARAS